MADVKISNIYSHGNENPETDYFSSIALVLDVKSLLLCKFALFCEYFTRYKDIFYRAVTLIPIVGTITGQLGDIWYFECQSSSFRNKLSYFIACIWYG